MRVPPDALRCVCYIGHTIAEEPVYEGTGFFISEPVPELPTKQHSYLVTAKHVAEKVAGNFWIRLNIKDGPAIPVPVDKEWVTHPTDSTADVAVMYWALGPLADHMPIARKILLPNRAAFTRECIGLRGQRYYSLACSSAPTGASKYANCRSGILAMIPDDRIRIAKDTDAGVFDRDQFDGRD